MAAEGGGGHSAQEQSAALQSAVLWSRLEHLVVDDPWDENDELLRRFTAPGRRLEDEWQAYWDETEDWSYERLLELDRNIVNRGGMHLAAVRALPTTVYAPPEATSGSGAAEDECKDCSVCLEPLKAGDTLLLLPCSHLFHPDCLRPWLRTNRRCPYCRFEMPRGDEFLPGHWSGAEEEAEEEAAS